MEAIELYRVRKSYRGYIAVDGLSFVVHPGEVFGLLGPNGAGKSSTIRMLLDIIRPDSGTIHILGEPMSERLKDRIGYLPEERGLYRTSQILETLVYLAELKGMPRRDARAGALHWLERVGLADRATSRLNALSKGMQQKVQLVATLTHSPDLVILDEPFSGLDPINIELFKEIIRELAAAGKTVVLSTHQLSQAEVMCDRLLLINRGRAVLYGDLPTIRAPFTRHAVRLDVDGDLCDLPGVERVEPEGRLRLAYLTADTSPQDILRLLVAQNRCVRRFELATPPLDWIFMTAVSGRNGVHRHARAG